MKSLSREQLQKMSKEELCAYFDFELDGGYEILEGPETVVTRVID